MALNNLITIDRRQQVRQRKSFTFDDADMNQVPCSVIYGFCDWICPFSRAETYSKRHIGQKPHQDQPTIVFRPSSISIIALHLRS